MTLKSTFELCGKPLDGSVPPLIVAEIGFNHNGQPALAEAMIQSAAEHGADLVKLQTFRGAELYAQSFRALDPDHPGTTIPFYKFWQRYELPPEAYRRLFDMARDLGVPLFSTPFDLESLRMLVDLGLPAIKIASGDLTYTDLLKEAGATGLPVVLSSGMATEAELAAALEVLEGAGAQEVLLLHCVSHYPAEPEEMNLACLPYLRERFGVPVGLSDHTLQATSALTATALGAVMIEKHFTTDCHLPGVDQALSMEPRDLKRLKDAVGEVHRTLGRPVKEPQPAELETRRGARRSLVARRAIARGTVITADLLACKRPGTGIPAERAGEVIGRTARADIPAETLLSWDQF